MRLPGSSKTGYRQKLNKQGSGYSWYRPRKRKRFYHKRPSIRMPAFRRRYLTAFALTAMGSVLGVVAWGQVGITLTPVVPQSVTPDLSTSTAAVLGVNSSTTPQSTDADGATSTPPGIGSIDPQNSDGTASTAAITGQPAPTAQISDGTLTNTEPSGTTDVTPQTLDGASTNTEPTGTESITAQNSAATLTNTQPTGSTAISAQTDSASAVTIQPTGSAAVSSQTEDTASTTSEPSGTPAITAQSSSASDTTTRPTGVSPSTAQVVDGTSTNTEPSGSAAISAQNAAGTSVTTQPTGVSANASQDASATETNTQPTGAPAVSTQGSSAGSTNTQPTGSSAITPQSIATTATNTEPNGSVNVTAQASAGTETNTQPTGSAAISAQTSAGTVTNTQPTGSATVSAQTSAGTETNTQPTGSATVSAQTSAGTETNTQPTGSATVSAQTSAGTVTNTQPTGSAAISAQNVAAGVTGSQPTGSAAISAQTSAGTVTNTQPTGSAAVGAQTSAGTLTNTQPTGSATVNAQTSAGTVTNTQPTGSAAISAQTSAGTVTNTQPTGSAAISAQTSAGTLTNTQPTGSAAISAQTSAGTVTNTQPTGSAAISTQDAAGTVTTAEPTGSTAIIAQTSAGTAVLAQPTGSVAISTNSSNSIATTTAPSGVAVSASGTWYVGALIIDADADGSSDDFVVFALTDVAVSGVYDTLDLSTDDITFGEGALGNGTTGTDNDERITAAGNVRLGDNYTFAVQFNSDPASVTDEVGINSSTWFTGSFTIDADADGTVDDTVSLVLSDANSDGVYDALDISRNLVFGQGTLTDQINTPVDDELIVGTENVRLGAHYTFEVSFSTKPAADATDMAIESKSWYEGTFTIDADADGVANDTVNFALVDDDSDGLYEKLDLSSDDTTFGEGTLGDFVTGTNNDETITSTNVRLGDNYTFDVTFSSTPGSSATDASIESKTWYEGTFTIDADADGTADNTVNFASSDTDSDGVYDALDLSSDDTTFGEGTLTDQITGANDDEKITGTENVRLGTNYTFETSFSTKPAADATDASIESKTWYEGTFTIDADADGTADNTVNFASSDTDSDGVYDALDLSSDDTTFGEGTLTDRITGSNDDEKITGTENVRLGANYTFETSFSTKPAADATDASIESKTWYEGTFTIDADADGTADDTVNFASSDTDSDGVYDALDLSSDDTTFGEGTLTDQITGSNDDEKITGTENVRLGENYTFETSFSAKPAADATDASIESKTWYEGTFTIDADADGTADNTVNFASSDTDSDGVYDALDLSSDDTTFGEGTLTDQITGANDDEKVTGTENVRLGANYTFETIFSAKPAADATDASIESKSWYEGTFTIDSDADGTADNTVNFASSDTDSDGVYDALDLSSDDTTFGEGTLTDQITGANDDEKITGTENVRLGANYTFETGFSAKPAADATDASIESKTWYEGTFTVDADADGSVDDTVNFASSDTDSDGVYDALDLSSDDTTFGEGSLSNNEVAADDDEKLTAIDTVSMGSGFEVSFSAKPAADAADASIASDTWYRGTFTIDADADGTADDTVNFVSSDTNSDGIFDTLELSSDDATYGEGTLTDQITGANDDEKITGTENVRLGANYTFEVEFSTRPSVDATDASIESKTWYEGTFTIDADADGTANDTVNFASSDTDSDGVYDALDLSSDDTTFGEGTLTDQITGSDDDEKVTGTENVRLGANYTFEVGFSTKPAADATDASVESKTWYEGTFTIDSYADGTADNTVNFASSDTDSDGVYDALDLSSDDTTFGEGTLTDQATGSNDDEKITGTETVELGAYYDYEVEFSTKPAADATDASIESKSWYEGTFTIDADADGTADDTVNFALVDNDSDGLYERLDLSSDDTTFGEGTLGDFVTGSNNDERVSGTNIRLGANYTFDVDFSAKPGTAATDASITSVTWYEGTFTIDADADGTADDTVSFVTSDTNSDGVYDALDLSSDDTTFGEGTLTDQATGSNDDEKITGTEDVQLGTYTFGVAFSTKPAADFTDASVTSDSWFTGTFTIDADADGTADNTVNFVSSDTNSDGVYDALDLSSDDATYGEGTLTDQITGTNDDEKITGTENVRLGAYYTFEVSFSTKPGSTVTDGSIESKTWYEATFDIDSDADGTADDTVNVALVDDDSDGLYEKMELSIDDTTFGEGTLTDFVIGTNDDERVSGTNVRLGSFYTFDLDFEGNPAGVATDLTVTAATWYTGDFTIDSDADGTADDTINYALVDTDSDGIYEAMDISAIDDTFGESDGRGGTLSDGIATDGNDEVINGTNVQLGDYYTFDLEFSDTPAADATDATISSQSWYEGTFTIDANADASADDTVSFVLSDIDSDGVYDRMDLSSDDTTFGEGTLTNQITGSDTDEQITGSETVRLGDSYTFDVTFSAKPGTAAVDGSITSSTWFTGDFTIDAAADGSANDTISFVLADTDSNGLYDTQELSSDDTTFGEGTQTNQTTGSGDDEKIATGEDVRFGSYYTFTVAFESNPATTANDASITSKTWFTGTLDIDVNADETDGAEVNFALVDNDSDGLYEILDLSTDDVTFGEGSLSNGRTGSNDDESVTGTNVRLGAYYTFDMDFASNPAGTASDVSATSNTWYEGTFTIDLDADGTVDNTVSYVISDADSDGLYGTMDISTDDTDTFGEGTLTDQITGSGDDEKVGMNEDVRLGSHYTFSVYFQADPADEATDATLTAATWYTGSIMLDADADGSDDDTLYLALTDTDSDGLYEKLDLSINDAADFGDGALDAVANSSGTDDAQISSDSTVTLGSYSYAVEFDANPAGVSADVVVTSETWFTGTFTMDAVADGSADETIYYAISDTNSNGVYDTMDLSIEDTTFGQGSLSDSVVKTSGGDNDERITTASDLKYEDDYTLTTTFFSNPAVADPDAQITSKTWFTGSFTIDKDADGTADDTISYVLVDTDSNGLYETMDLSTDDTATFGEGTLTDQITGGGDDETIATGEDVRFGSHYTFTTAFVANPPSNLTDATITSKTWFTGTVTIDIDANGVASGAADTLNFALVDTDSDGLVEQVEYSVNDTTFGEGSTSDLNLVDGNDEIVTGTNLTVGPNYKFNFEFDTSPGSGSSILTVESITWLTGTFTVDIDADGIASGAADTINFALVDSDSNGVFERLELSVNDTDFREGTTGNQSSTDGDDEIIIGTESVVFGPTYSFSVAFDTSPETGTNAASVTSETHFDGSFVFDADASGATSTPSESVFYSLSDTNSDGVYETADISLGNSTFGQGTLTDEFVKSTAIGGSENDERISTTTTMRIGTTYAVEITFDPNPIADTSDTSLTLSTTGTTPIVFTNLEATGSWIVDTDGNKEADNRVHFVILDTNSDGVMDAIDISIGDELFGETSDTADLNGNDLSDGLEDGEVGEGGEDERLSVGSGPQYVKLGTHTFLVEFDTDIFADSDDARLTAAFYIGSFSAEGTTDTIDFIQVDDDSDGIYSIFELDIDGDGEIEAGEFVDTSPSFKRVGGVISGIYFSQNPTELVSAALRKPQDLLLIEGENLETDGDVQIPTDVVIPTSGRVSADFSGQPIVVDEIVITLDFDLENPEARLSEIVRNTGGKVIGGIPEINAYQMQFQVPSLTALEQLQGFLERMDGVISASKHYLIDISKGLPRIPNDTGYGSWNLEEPEGENWNMEFIRAPEAWDVTTGSRTVNVAVIDADLDPDHPELSKSVVSSSGGKSDIADGHGTHVAGTICAEGDNARGVSGVAWNCALRFYDFGGVSTVKALQTMIKAINDGADIVNVSLQWIDNGQCGKPGTPEIESKVDETNAIFSRAIEFAKHKDRDVLWVFAAGNECRDTRFASPASLVRDFPENVITVASIEVTGQLSPFSNFGGLIDVAAPGSQILSTLPQKCEGESCEEQYGVKSGTSMAAPHVLGLAVLVKAANPTFDAAKMKECIVQGATRQVATRGFNVINAPAAVRCGAPAPQGSESAPVGGGG